MTSVKGSEVLYVLKVQKAKKYALQSKFRSTKGRKRSKLYTVRADYCERGSTVARPSMAAIFFISRSSG